MPRDATTGACGWSDCGRLDRAAARRDEPGPETTRSGAHPSPLHDPRRPQEPRTRAEPSPLRRRGGRSAAARDQATARGGGAVRRRQTPGARRPRAGRGEDARGVPPRRGRPRGDPSGRPRGHRDGGQGPGQAHGAGDAEIQRPGGWQAGEPDRPRGAGGDLMSVAGGVAPSVLDTLEFPAALERVAAHAAGPLGAARVRGRAPATDPERVRAALAQVAELAALLLHDDAIRAEPVPDIGPALELLAVAGSALEGVQPATLTTVFVEPPEVIELGNALRSAEAEEQREVLRVLRELTDLLRPRRAALAAAWEMCVAFDDLCARARYAVEVNGFAPTVGAGPLEIRAGRHPLLEGGDVVVVPFDLELAPDEWTVLVSGPNTGGKTVLIKAVGLACLLAQSGVIPPIGPQSRLPVFHEVFADIGDRQSIAASLSTFSAHVAAVRDILERAGPASLVLLDEIGSGTDPAEGAALAAATLQALTRRHAVTLATTHLGAPKTLGAETVGIVNASLQFDAETLTPTYRLLKGVPGRSYGLAIARRLGVPADVLREAEGAVPDAERALDVLLAAVEGRADEQEARAIALDAAEVAARERGAELERGSGDVNERERALLARERALDKEARERARAYLLEARKTVEAALGQARAAVDEATAKQARRMVEEAIEKTKEVGLSDSRTVGPKAYKVGDRVRTGTNAVGTVLEIRDDGELVVQVGSVRLIVDSANVQPSDSPTVRRSDA